MRQYIYFEPARPIPEHIKLVQIDEDPWQIGKNYPVEVGVIGDTKAGARRTACAAESDSRRSRELDAKVRERTARHVAKHARRPRGAASSRSQSQRDVRPMTPLGLMGALANVLPPDVAVIEEAVTTTNTTFERLGVLKNTTGYFGHRGWALGWGLGVSIGVKLAWPERPVLALLGEGAAAYGIQGLWSAARYKIPVVFVICNNAQYQILKLCGRSLSLPEAGSGAVRRRRPGRPRARLSGAGPRLRRRGPPRHRARRAGRSSRRRIPRRQADPLRRAHLPHAPAAAAIWVGSFSRPRGLVWSPSPNAATIGYMAKSARRWYQVSLRTLLVLTAISSIPPGIYVGHRSYLEAKRRAEIEASFRWLESLGYADMPNARPVRVTTSYWQGEDKGEEKDSQVTIGFLLSEDAKSFKVLTPDLSSAVFERESREPWTNSNSGFERVELRKIARQVLEHARSKDRDRWDRFGSELSERGELFALAWACWREGHVGLAKDLYRAAEVDLDWNHDGDVPQPFLARLAADFAYMETWRATLDCGTKLPRPELLKKFRWLAKHFPQSQYAPDVARKVTVFESMVAENERHAKERESGAPFEQLPPSEQIAELIFQLRDQNGYQWSQPGWCDVLMTVDGEENSPGHRLLTYGYDAIPQLAAALGDERLTRSVGCHRSFYFSHRVLTVGDAAEQLLERIASRSFDTADRSESPAAQAAAVRQNALAWHAELTAKGERACLVEAVERAVGPSVSVARRLVEKYPDAACSAILTALSKTNDEDDRGRFIELLGRIHSDESVPFLVEELQHKQVWFRVKAAESLTALHRPEGIDVLLEQWQSSQRISELEGIGPFFAQCGRTEAVEAVTNRLLQQSIDERFETMDKAAEQSPERLAACPELRTAVIKLLLCALRDTEVRTGMSGSRGSKSFSDPRVCDMAGYHLNCLDAAAFPFDLGAPYVQREQERRAILASHGEQ